MGRPAYALHCVHGAIICRAGRLRAVHQRGSHRDGMVGSASRLRWQQLVGCHRTMPRSCAGSGAALPCAFGRSVPRDQEPHSGRGSTGQPTSQLLVAVLWIQPSLKFLFCRVSTSCRLRVRLKTIGHLETMRDSDLPYISDNIMTDDLQTHRRLVHVVLRSQIA